MPTRPSTRQKLDFPVDKTRRHLEPGPLVLISSAWKGRTNIMTLGWHMMFGWDQVATYIWNANHSFNLIRKSAACVINVPTADMAETVVGIGNCHGGKIDKFEQFGLTPVEGDAIEVPSIAECYASFECTLADESLIDSRGIFLWNVVKARVAATPKNPKTIHYRGDGEFMLGGKSVDLSAKFRPENL